MPEGLTDAQIIERIERMERQLRAISDHLGLPYDDGSAGVPPEVVELARGGDRMGAAARLRELTGCDFVEAQRIVSGL